MAYPNSPEFIQQVMALWNEGLSAGQIGRSCGKSRCAIIGIVSRNKALVSKYRQAPTYTARMNRPKAPKKMAAPIIQQAPLPEPEVLGPENEFPERGKCQFTKDDVSQPGWRMCGHPIKATDDVSQPGLRMQHLHPIKATAFCEYHTGICYTKHHYGKIQSPSPDAA